MNASRADRLRLATTTTFALSGFVIASWAVRIPDVSAQVAASHSALGGALLCLSLGALATMRLTGALCERIGAGAVSTLGAVLLCATVAAPSLASSVVGLGAVLILFGAATGMLNVAMNSVGVRLEGTSGRAVLPSLHAAFSFGGLAGSLVGGVAASQVAAAPHLLAVGGAGLLVVSFIARPLTASDETGPGATARPPSRPGLGAGRARTVVLTLGAIAACTAYGEGALSDWTAVHLAGDLHAAPMTAAAGYAAFSLAMGCGRLGGHRLLDLLGETRLVVYGALTAALGMLVTAVSPVVTAGLVGLVLAGIGLSNIFPLAIARAGALGGSRGVGLASTVAYGGLLLGPPLIGLLASRVGLPTALTTLPALALVAAGLALGLRAADRAPALAFPLPWSRAEVLVRLRGSLQPVGAAVQTAARQHATGLTLLYSGDGAQSGDPGGRTSAAGPAAPGRRSPFRDLELLLGGDPDKLVPAA